MTSEMRKKRNKWIVLAAGLERIEHTNTTMEERRTRLFSSCVETFIKPVIEGNIKEMRR
jgi:hypothetical protein